MEDDDSAFHLTVYFSGRVQGVGFRYQVYNIAKGYETTGFVCNLTDGRVQLELEGEEAEVNNFVAEIMDQMEGFIHEVEQTDEYRHREFQGFLIK